MVEVATALFDAILVHGDPAFLPFDATFARADEIADLIHYTGYVVEPIAIKGQQGRGEVIVSAGSSATGEALLRTALAARSRTSLRNATWRLLAGQGWPVWSVLVAGLVEQVAVAARDGAAALQQRLTERVAQLRDELRADEVAVAQEIVRTVGRSEIGRAHV